MVQSMKMADSTTVSNGHRGHGAQNRNGGTDTESGTAGTSSVFENPLVDKILANMTKEDREFYEDMGKQVYDKIKFEVVTEGMDGNEVPLEEVVANIRSALMSGLRPEDLEESEAAAMRTYYEGDTWKNEFS